ncbi:MAG: hypothetical protein F082_361 [bacterium F082]|nr:MAG: hypothetical protein F082_361 [bacterium F082]KWW30130.1 MAG: hypothetical protein AUK64_919 [bacterium P201]
MQHQKLIRLRQHFLTSSHYHIHMILPQKERMNMSVILLRLLWMAVGIVKINLYYWQQFCVR